MSDPTGDTSPTNTPPAWALVLGFALIYVSWGTTYYVTSYAMARLHLPPALFGGMRLVLAGSILLVYQAVRGQSLRLSWPDAGRLFLISVCLFLSANLLITIAQKRVPSGVAAILVATTPLWMGLFGMLWPHGERLSWRGWLGLLLGFAGIALTMQPQWKDGYDLGSEFGPLLVLGSAASWAIGALFSRQFALKISHLTSAGFQMLFGGVSQVLVGTGFNEWPILLERLNWSAALAFIYLLVVGSLTGFVAFNWLLGHVSAAKVGTYAYVNPIIAVFIGWLMNETQIHRWLLAGIAVILAGVYLVRGDHVPSEEVELEPD
jgi:drug/metabolite transporter (DMT)-like permease